MIDDDPDVRYVCRLNLGWDGHEVVEATDGAQGLELLLSSNPDVIVLDLMMPGLDGFEVLRRIRACPDTSRVPVVLLTALVATQDQIDGWRGGADGYLTKPFSPSELVRAVRQIASLHPFDRVAERESRLNQLIAS